MNRIPNTIKSMRYTFRGCKNLSEMPSLPPELENLDGGFFECKKITELKNIPNSVISMEGTFFGCIRIKKISNIPSSLVNMSQTYYNCPSLEDVYVVIPAHVSACYNTFRDCTNLSGTIEISASLNGNILDNGRRDYENFFLNSAKSEKKLTLICSSEIYELFNDNAVKLWIFNSDSNIKLEKKE